MDIILEYEHIWECQLNTRKTHMEVQWNINGWKSIQSNSSGPLHILHSSRFLLLCLPQKDQAHDQRRDDDEWLPTKLCFGQFFFIGSHSTPLWDDEGVGVMHELNAIKEYHEVEQETWGVVLLVGRWDNLERVGRERQQIRLRVNMGI